MSSESPLEQLLGRILLAEERGELLDREALLAEHPDVADDVREFLADHDALKPGLRCAMDDAPTLDGIPPSPDIASAAGVSVGTFYRYFGDKRDILLEIASRELKEAHQNVLSLLTPAQFVGQKRRDTIANILRILVAAIARRPEIQSLTRLATKTVASPLNPRG